MKKRDVAQITVLALLVVSVMMLALYGEQNRRRTMMNVQAICDQLEQLTSEKCALQLPPSGLADRNRRTDSGERLLAAVTPKPVRTVSYRPEDCPVLGSSRGVYHTAASPYRSMVKYGRCFATIGEAQDAGFRPPG